LVTEGTPQLAAELSSIRYSSSVTVGLGYDEKVRRALPPGFGFLVPCSEKVRIMAATFVHNKFPQRVPQNRALIRCFLGGTRDPQVLDLPEGEIAEIVRQDLAEVLGIRAAPDFAYVYKWEQAMAQYEVGHRAKIARIQNLLAENPSLALAGNYLGGIGVPDCVRSGSEAAAKISAELEI
jgi:oxygen-dependent protoporphyrinogen oxidase